MRKLACSLHNRSRKPSSLLTSPLFCGVFCICKQRHNDIFFPHTSIRCGTWWLGLWSILSLTTHGCTLLLPRTEALERKYKPSNERCHLWAWLNYGGDKSNVTAVRLLGKRCRPLINHFLNSPLLFEVSRWWVGVASFMSLLSSALYVVDCRASICCASICPISIIFGYVLDGAKRASLWSGVSKPGGSLHHTCFGFPYVMLTSSLLSLILAVLVCFLLDLNEVRFACFSSMWNAFQRRLGWMAISTRLLPINHLLENISP